MRGCIVSSAAEHAIESILRWTDEHFGERARLRYEALLIQAIADLAQDPERPGSHNRPEIAPAARTLIISGIAASESRHRAAE